MEDTLFIYFSDDSREEDAESRPFTASLAFEHAE